MTQNFSSDKPVSEKQEDRFQRYGFSKRIAETIIKRNDSDGLVIGLYGAWGEGKTSVLNFIEKELKEQELVITLKFNPWRYKDEEILIKTFFKKIASAFGQNLENRKERFGKLISKYGGIKKIFGFDLDKLGNILIDVDLEELKERVNNFIIESKCKLVIFVDDIDRLDKQEIYSLFRLIKLTADFSNTIYILALDEIMVASAIGERFGVGGQNSGENFLEKIIQVPLKIPQAQIGSLKDHCFELIDKAISESEIEIDKKEIQKFVSEFSSNVLHRLKTPRLAVRYGNSLSFSLPLLKGDINYVDLMLVEALKIFYPKHYEFLKSNPRLFLATNSLDFTFNKETENANRKKEISDQLESLTGNLTKNEKESVFDILNYLFPQLDEVFNNSYKPHGYEKWYKEKRISSYSYFNRYFTYSLSKDEISDNIFKEFVNKLNEYDEVQEVFTNISRLLENCSIDTFLNKIRTFEDQLSWENSKKIVLALAQNSTRFKKNGSFFNIINDGEAGQVIIFINNLIKKQKDKSKRIELAKTLMQEQISFDFSYEINHSLRFINRNDVEIFNSLDFKELAEILRIRALNDSGNSPIYEKYSEYIHFILPYWNEINPTELKEYLLNILNKNPLEIVNLLKAITPTAQSSNEPNPYKSNFSIKEYQMTIAILDKKLIHDLIIEHFNIELITQKVEFFEMESKQTDINILAQFEHWYSLDN